MTPKLPKCFSSDWVMDPFNYYFSIPPGGKSKLALDICKAQIAYLEACSKLENDMYIRIAGILEKYEEDIIEGQ